MDKKQVLAFVMDELTMINAQLKTASYAAGNRELLGDNPQSIALTLDVIGNELENCCKILNIVLEQWAEEI